MNPEQLDFLLHTNGWERPYPNANGGDLRCWFVRMTKDIADPTPKEIMAALFELAGIEPQSDWIEGEDTSAFIRLPRL